MYKCIAVYVAFFAEFPPCRGRVVPVDFCGQHSCPVNRADISLWAQLLTQREIHAHLSADIYVDQAG